MLLARGILCVVLGAVGLSPAALLSGESAPARVSVKFNATPFKAALAELQEKSGLKISFAEKQVAHALPVTLNRENVPVEKVLQELLRPEGLEAIQTDEKLIAVVPAYSDIAMAKAFGRALTIGIRLGNKLDGAVLAGDEVRVPAWTDADDHELAQGLTDLIAAIAYFENTRRSGTTNNDPQLERLLNSNDPLVRAGVPMPLIANGMRYRLKDFNAQMKKGLTSPNSAERTGWALLFAASLERSSKELQIENSEATLAALTVDPEASVRMAATLALILGLQRNFDADGKMMERLLKDRSMFVRQTPRFMLLANPGLPARLGNTTPAKQLQTLQTNEGIQAMLGDANPIARAVSLAFALAAANGKADRTKPISDCLTTLDLSQDPWMGWIRKRLSPILADDPSVPFVELRDAALSTKRSHQIAAVAIFAESLIVRQSRSRGKGTKPVPRDPVPDLAGFTQLSQSDWLWARLIGILADGLAPAAASFSETRMTPEQLEQSEKRFRAALVDPNESTRLFGTLAALLRKSLRVPAGPGYSSDEQFTRAAQSRVVAEMMLGTMLSAQHLPSDQIITHLETLMRGENQRDAAASLIAALHSGNQQIRLMKPEQQIAFWKSLADRVLAHQDLTLEAALAARLSWGTQERLKAVVPVVLKNGHIETVLALSTSDIGSRLSDEETVSLLVDRLEEAAEDKTRHKQVLQAWHQLASSNALWNHIPANMFKVLNSALLEAPADAEEEALRIQALLSYWTLADRGDKKSEVLLQKPHAAAIAGMQRIFAQVADKKLFPQAPTLVVRTVEFGRRKTIAPHWAAHCPALLSSAEAALRAILDSDRIDDKIEVWALLARMGDKATINTLATLVNEGGLSPEHTCIAINALVADTTLLPEWYGKTLLRIARDENQKQEVRAAALNSAGVVSKTIQDDLEAMVFDTTLSEKIRTHAVHAAGTSEKSRVFQKALDSFDAQPGFIVSALLDRAIYSLKAPGAADFVLRALPDKRVVERPNAWMSFSSLTFNLSQERFITAFKEPQKLVEALDTIEKHWPENELNDFKAHVLPQLQRAKQKIAEMKAKATAKAKSTAPAVRPPPPPDDF